MSQEEANSILERLKEFSKEVTSSKEKARQALVNAGLITPDGQPTAPYKA